ncbi:MAG: hypothetical protein J5477_00205 [Schwartzia sp.]|nr:hypothetical protein [Schwartzia sp. (in: firmicutes)]
MNPPKAEAKLPRAQRLAASSKLNTASLCALTAKELHISLGDCVSWPR